MQACPMRSVCACRRPSGGTNAPSWWRRWLSAWASTSPTCVLWHTLICRKTWRAIIRKRAGPDVMAIPRTVCCFTARRIWRSCSISRVRRRTKSRGVLRKSTPTPCWSMRNATSAAARRCCRISGKISRSPIAADATYAPGRYRRKITPLRRRKRSPQWCGAGAASGGCSSWTF